MLRKLLLLFLLATAASGPAQAQRASHVISSLPELTDSIRRVMAKEHIPGLMLVLATRARCCTPAAWARQILLPTSP